MTDDLVARLRAYDGRVWETTVCYNGLREEAAAVLEQERGDARTLRGFVATYKMTPSMMASRAEIAEARVRELEAERDKWDRRVAYDELQAREHENRATQQHQIDALTIRAEAAERAIAGAYERAAKESETCWVTYTGRASDAERDQIDRARLDIATAIRNLAQEVKHEAE